MCLPETREKMTDVTTAKVFFPENQGDEKQGQTNLQAGSPTSHHPTTMFTALLPWKKRGKISLVLCRFHFFFHPKSCAVLLYWITTQTWPYCSRLHVPHGNCKKINSVLSETRTTRHHGFAKKSCLPSLITCDEMSDLAEVGAPADIPHLTTSTSSVFLSPIKSSQRSCWSMD